MDRLVYIASATAARLETAQAVAANNLANASTTGFKADLLASRAALLQGDGWDSRVYAPVTGVGLDASAGAVHQTGRDLDVAIGAEGALAVQAADGAEAYTRAGNLRVSASGLLETANGLPVLGDGGPLLIPPLPEHQHRPRRHGVGGAGRAGAQGAGGGRAHQAGQPAAGQRAKGR